MIVCHCSQVSDREIRNAVRGGACSIRQVGRACEAGHGCGGCKPAILDLIESEAPAETAAPLFALAATG